MRPTSRRNLVFVGAALVVLGLFATRSMGPMWLVVLVVLGGGFVAWGFSAGSDDPPILRAMGGSTSAALGRPNFAAKLLAWGAGLFLVGTGLCVYGLEAFDARFLLGMGLTLLAAVLVLLAAVVALYARLSR